MANVATAAPAPAFLDIAKYGALGDGNTLDSAAINKAIDAANSAGGGTVYFPAGTWLSGSIHLKSNVTLYLEQGATILATSDPEAYDAPEPNQWDKYQDFGHSHFHNSLIWGEELENVAILGMGRIYGKGLTRSDRQSILQDYSLGFFRDVENVTITNCMVSGFDNGTFLDGTYQRKLFNKPNSNGPTGRIKFGTESSGGFKNITISNCVFDYCRGLALFSDLTRFNSCDLMTNSLDWPFYVSATYSDKVWSFCLTTFIKALEWRSLRYRAPD